METQERIASTIELDAHEFGLHLKQGGWRLGLLVARNVEPGEGQGQPRGERREEAKISATEFSRLAFGHANGEKRVMRYYRAWGRYADKGKVPHADDLRPGDEPNINWDRLPHWTLSEAPDTGGATGPLNTTIKLGQYGDRLLRSHQRLVTFLRKDLKETPGKQTRELAGRYADALETQAVVLRRVEAGERPTDIDALEPRNFFPTAR